MERLSARVSTILRGRRRSLPPFVSLYPIGAETGLGTGRPVAPLPIRAVHSENKVHSVVGATDAVVTGEVSHHLWSEGANRNLELSAVASRRKGFSDMN